MRSSSERLRLVVAVAGLAFPAAFALAQDVTNPGDATVASSTNHPAGEPPSAAIDNAAGTKYLNFDIVNTGFSVTPSGTGTVRGLTIITANDAPERDPASFVLEGSDDGTNWSVIAQGALNPPTARFAVEQVRFVNDAVYAQYRVTFPTVRNAGSANSMQVGEVQLVTATDVLTPGDSFTAILTPGASFPPNEGPTLLWDNRCGTKMGIFNGNLGPTLVDVTPGVGASTVTGFDIFSGNDDLAFPGRAPQYVGIFGSNDGGANYTLITTVILAAPIANYADQQFFFENTTSYESYRLEIGPTQGATFLQIGEIQLFGTVSTAPPENDECSNAQTVVAGSTGGDNFNATGTDISSCGDADSKDVWFRYQATSSGLVEANTCNSGPLDTTISVYASCGGAELVCNDNTCGIGARARWEAQSGATYFIRIAAVGEEEGAFTLTIDENPAVHEDVQVPMPFNFNGMVHEGEEGAPDEANGFRSISDRAMRITGTGGSFEVGLEGPSGMAYSVPTQANTLDILHLGNRNTVDNGNWAFDLEADGDDIGTQPAWLSDSNQAGPHTVNVFALGLNMGADTRIGILYNTSNGGGSFDVTLTFDDNSTVLVGLSAPDWFGDQVPPDAFPGIDTQEQAGVYFGSENVDSGNAGVDLNVVEGVISVQDLIADGFGDITGRQLTSITFANSTNFVAGTAIYAITVRDADTGCRADYDGDGFLTGLDFDAFVVDFENGDPATDYDGDGFVTGLDFDAYVVDFEAGC